MSTQLCDNSTTLRTNVPCPITGISSVAQSTMFITNSEYAGALASALGLKNITDPTKTNLEILTDYTSTTTEVLKAFGVIGSAVASSFANLSSTGVIVGVQALSGLDLYSLSDSYYWGNSSGANVTFNNSYGFALAGGGAGGGNTTISTGVDFFNNPYGSSLTVSNISTGTVYGYLRMVHRVGDFNLTIAAPVILDVNSVALCLDSNVFPPESGCSDNQSDGYFNEECYQFDNCPYA